MFHSTPSWQRLETILKGNGGCYGLYGPRGSGKSWLMLKAIECARVKQGMGIWFPCPSGYDANAFLSALSDNLANEVERHFLRDNTMNGLLATIRRILTFVAVVVFGFFAVSFGLAGPKGFQSFLTFCRPGFG
jgi:predicted ATPase